MSVNESMTAIADMIRRFTGKEKGDGLTLAEMPGEIAEVYSVGAATGELNGRLMARDEFWDAFQDNGARTDYYVAFYGKGWNNITFKPPYPIKPTNANNMLTQSSIAGDLRLIVDIDTSQCLQFGSTFGYMGLVTHIGVVDFRKSTSTSTIGGNFSYDTELIEIEKIILKDDGSQKIGAFTRCDALKEIRFSGTIGTDVDFKNSPLSKESIRSVFDALADNAITVTFNENAVNKAFETSEGANDGSTSHEWKNLVAAKPNVSISLLNV